MGITADPFHKARKYCCGRTRLNIGAHLTTGTVQRPQKISLLQNRVTLKSNTFGSYWMFQNLKYPKWIQEIKIEIQRPKRGRGNVLDKHPHLHKVQLNKVATTGG